MGVHLLVAATCATRVPELSVRLGLSATVYDGALRDALRALPATGAALVQDDEGVAL